MNNCNFIGFIGDDPKLGKTDNGIKKASFTLIVKKPFKNSKDVGEPIFCIAFNKNADIVNNYLVKGNQVGLSGRLEPYKLKKGGFGYNINVGSFTFLNNQKNNDEKHFEDFSF